MSEDSTTPHESDSHASSSSSSSSSSSNEEPEVTAQQNEAQPAAVPVEVPEPEPVVVKTTAAAIPEPTVKRVHEPIPVAVEESGTKQTFDKVLKIANDAWVKAQPILKEKGTQALLVANRFTNDFLDNTGPKLKDQVIAKIPDSTKAKVEEQKAKLQPTLDKLQPLWDKGVVPFWQKVVVPAWNKGLAFLRQKLPANLQELTDRFLTAAIITIVVFIYWFFSSLTSGKPAVAKQPPVPTKPVLTRPVPRPIAQRPTVVPKSAPSPTIRPSVSSPRSAAPVIPPKSATAATPQAETIPVIDLAEIQTQLASAAAGVGEAGEGLVAAVKTANANQQIKVSLSTAWDSLSDTEQKTVAQKLWMRSQKLEFSKLELLDSTNTVVARSPVVGSNVIMLQQPARSKTLPTAD
jgi:hypothetical protein